MDNYYPELPEEFFEENDRQKKLFREMNADAGIEMTPKEASVNFAACSCAIMAVTKFGWTIEKAIDAVQSFAAGEFHPGVCRKFLTEAIELMEEGNAN